MTRPAPDIAATNHRPVEGLIDDHPYRPDRQGQWRNDRCDLCGEPRNAHAEASWHLANGTREGQR